MGSPFHFAVRRLRRGWKSGELLILILALTVAVAAVSTVSLFTERLTRAIESQTGETLGADVMFVSRAEIPPPIVDLAIETGARLTKVVTFASIAFSGDQSALSSIKAVENGYPLRGKLGIADEPFGQARVANGIPAPGEAWVDLRLWQELRLSKGARLRLGATEVTVTAVITEEPGRGAGFTDLAPRVLIGPSDLEASGLLSPGARAQYMLMLAGDADQLEAVMQVETPNGVERRSPREARPELNRAMQRAGDFMSLARLSAALLSAAAIALCAWQWGLRLRDEVALLKCLGARQAFILRAMAWMLLLMGAFAGLAGVLIGLAAQEVIAQLLAGLMRIDLPAPPLLPLLQAWLAALVLLGGFALPPLLQARDTPPIRVFQRDTSVPGRRLPALAAALAVLCLLWWQTSDWKAAALVLGGSVAVCALLALFGALLVQLLTPLKQAVGASWRFGLGNIARRRGGTIAQAVALGLALLALLLVSVVQRDLLATWRSSLPPGTPNQFLINIQTGQLPEFRKFFADRGYADLQVWPMARGRLVGLRGEPVSADRFDDPRTQSWINRDFNISWTDSIGDDNEILDGEWWGPEARGQALMSAEDYAVERLNLKIGDTLTLDFAGNPITFTIHNTRRVKWDSFRPNFFLLVPPGVLEEQAAAQWLSSFYLPPEQRGELLRELIATFPNVTVLDIEVLMNQVRGIMDRIVAALEFLFLFTLAAGLTVLLAAIETTRGERVRETGLLRALGARSRVITNGLLAEYAVLGLLAGTVAAIAAQIIAWLLAEHVFNIPYGPRPLFWVAGAGVGAALVTLLGWISLRSTLTTAPHHVLRGAD